jgi:tRNA(adenine34) deaminase
MELSSLDRKCFDKAVQLAYQAEQEGNLPIGAVISYQNAIIAEGRNAIWFPQYRPDRHAEVEAMRKVPEDLWKFSSDMTLYTTLEPCLMCLAACLLHHIGRVIFGSADDYGGASMVIGHLPTFFSQQASRTEWIGPAHPSVCDELFKRVMQKVEIWQEQGD